VDRAAGAAEDVLLPAGLDGGGKLRLELGLLREEGAGDDPPLVTQVGEDLADHFREAQRVERRAGGFEEAVAFGVEDEDGDGVVGLERLLALAAKGVEAALDEEGLAVGQEDSGLRVEAEYDLDGALDDLVAPLGQVQDFGERVERIAL